MAEAEADQGLAKSLKSEIISLNTDLAKLQQVSRLLIHGRFPPCLIRNVRTTQTLLSTPRNKRNEVKLQALASNMFWERTFFVTGSPLRAAAG